MITLIVSGAIAWIAVGVYSAGLLVAFDRAEYRILDGTPFDRPEILRTQVMASFLFGPIGLMATVMVYGTHHGWMNPLRTFRSIAKAKRAVTPAASEAQ